MPTKGYRSSKERRLAILSAADPNNHDNTGDRFFRKIFDLLTGRPRTSDDCKKRNVYDPVPPGRK